MSRLVKWSHTQGARLGISLSGEVRILTMVRANAQRCVIVTRPTNERSPHMSRSKRITPNTARILERCEMVDARIERLKKSEKFLADWRFYSDADWKPATTRTRLVGLQSW